VKAFYSAIVVLLLSAIVRGQVTTSNPLDDRKAQVEAVLERAGVPFTEAQTRELTLVMEEQRQASEQLFGDIMDFSRGPVQGAQRDRALAGIQWMNEAFEAKLKEVLTPEQNRIWEEFRTSEIRSQGGLPALRMILSDAGVPLDANQERRAQAIYQDAAGRLRELAPVEDADPRTIQVKEDALARIAELLTLDQQNAVIEEFARVQREAGAAGARPTASNGTADPRE
jgi:hypothetical protein